jgi:hypothetical protein
VVLALYDETRKGCTRADLKAYDFSDHDLPTIDNLIVARYEISTARERIWHEYEDFQDLTKNLGLGDAPLTASDHSDRRALKGDVCPKILFFPAGYANALGLYYQTTPNVTVENGGIKVWNPDKTMNWRQWVWSHLKVPSLRLINREPFSVSVAVVPNAVRQRVTDINDVTSEDRIFRVSGTDAFLEVSDVYVGDSIFLIDDDSSTVDDEGVCSAADGPDCGDNAGAAIKPTPDAFGDELVVMPANEYDLKGSVVKVYLRHSLTEKEGSRRAHRTVRFDVGKYRDPQSKIFFTPKNIATRHTTTMMTHTRNAIMPVVLPHTSEVGFKKMRMPPGFHQRLLRFYRKHYKKRSQEGWPRDSTQLNAITVPSFMVSLDSDFNERNSIAQDVIQPLLEEWTNKSLEFSAFYGIREYFHDSALRNHVDRVETHVASAILQIGQSGVDDDNDPWTLEVYGFDGKRYNIALKPGDMVLYEGHALIHGRPKPLSPEGAKYINAFCHFRPAKYTWSANKAFNTEVGKDIMSKLHLRGMHDVYR